LEEMFQKRNVPGNFNHSMLEENRVMKRKIKLALIATYPTMAEIFVDITKDRGDLEARSIYASFDRAAQIAREMERTGEVDVVLSRGATAAQIQSSVELPVIFIPITPFDVIQVVRKLGASVRRIALIHYMRHVPGVQEIAKMYNIQVEEYSFFSQKDIEAAVYDAYRKGIRTIVGGEVSVRVAKSMGLSGFQVSAGREAVERAVEEALTVFTEKQKERNKAVQMKAAYDSLKEGVVVMDEEKRIVVMNRVAEELFDRKYKLGDRAGTDVIGDKYWQQCQAGKECSVYLRKIKKATYGAAHMPVTRKKRFIGVVTRLEDVTRTQEMEQKIRNELHLKGFVAKYRFENIVTADSGMKRVLQQARVYAATDSSVLIEGESGTGKELLAQSIHNASCRADGPFVAVNCGAIPENLLESELFGYEAGSFTGAKKEGKAGLFELAHNGTLFLDEIGEISGNVQTRLLRVLQEREIMRVGGSRIIPVNVRVISATNRNLRTFSQEGGFRGDLYYRLNVLHLSLPPLRKRMGDVPVLAERFFREYGKNEEKQARRLKAVIPILTSYSWPGNIRELQNTMERYGVLSELMETERMGEEELREILGTSRQDGADNTMQLDIRLGGELSEIVKQVECEVAKRYLEDYGNNQDLAAKALGIGRTTFWRKCGGKGEEAHGNSSR